MVTALQEQKGVLTVQALAFSGSSLGSCLLLVELPRLKFYLEKYHKNY